MFEQGSTMYFDLFFLFPRCQSIVYIVVVGGSLLWTHMATVAVLRHLSLETILLMFLVLQKKHQHN